MKDLFQIAVFTCYIRIFASYECDGYRACCNGYMWDEATQNCKMCDNGFYGKKCELKCPYPLYGKGCLKICTCAQEDCNSETGCNRSRESIEISTVLRTTLVTGEVNKSAKRTKAYAKSSTLTTLKLPEGTISINGTSSLKADPMPLSHFSNKSLFYTVIILGLLVTCLIICYIIFSVWEKLHIPANSNEMVGNAIEMHDLSQRNIDV